MNTDEPTGPAVFISYAHDNDAHIADVLDLASFLESRGIAVELDHWHADPRPDWYAWILRTIETADFVLVVASPQYRAFGDGPDGDTHRGVQAETAILRECLYQDRKTWVNRVLPVVLPGRSLDELPKFTQPYSAGHFVIDTITDDGVDDLLRVLTGQPKFARPPRGRVPALARFPATDRVRRVLGSARWKIVALTVTPLLAGILTVIPPSWAPVNAKAHDASQAAADSPAVRESDSSDASNPSRTTAPAADTRSGHRNNPATSGPDADPSGPADEQDGSPGGGSGSHDGTIEILAVGHTFAPGIDRITATIRNSRPDPALVTQIRIYMDRPTGGWHGDDTWRFTLPEDMQPGDPGDNGARRTQGLVKMSGTEFQAPLIGQGYVRYQGFRRLLSFEPQKSLAGSATATIVIDIPNTMLLQSSSPEQPAGPMVEYEFNPQVGAIFTYFELTTPEDLSYACDYLRRSENNPSCGATDPLALVALPS